MTGAEMKFVSVLLIFTAVVGWSVGEISAEVGDDSPNWYINRKRIRNIKESIDEDAHPCSDFYKYACGKWSEKHEAINSQYTSVEDMINYDVNMEFTQYLKSIRLDDIPKFVKNAVQLFSSCVSRGDEFNGLEFLQKMQKYENVTIALLSSGEEDEDSTFDWVHTLAIIHRYGGHFFLKEWMYPKITDRSKNIVHLFRPEHSRMSQDNIDALKETVTLPANADKSFDELFGEFQEFEDKLDEIINADYEDMDKKIISPDELPISDVLLKYLEIALDESPLDQAMELSIEHIGYFEALEGFLKQYDNKFICLYLEVKFLYTLNFYASQKSDIECIQLTRDMLPLSMDWIYMQLHPELELELPKIVEIFNVTLEQVKKTLNSDRRDIIPEGFLEELDKVELKIGNVPLIDTAQVLETAFVNLTLNSSDFYGNVMKIIELYHLALHSTTTYERNTDATSYFEVSDYQNEGVLIKPYYDKTANIVFVPFSLLTQPVYHWGYEDLFKYSFLGVYLIEPIYNDLAVLNSFDAIDRQRIADLGSLHSVFDLYFSNEHKDFEERHSMNEQEMKQLFFLNAAHSYCQKDIPSNDYNKVNFIASHMVEFTETFDCKMDSFLELFNHN